MSGTSSQGNSKEYVVRIPKSLKKKYHMMRFNAEHGADFFKNWSQCRIERENNLREFKADEDTPKFGAGSEYGRDQREEARRKRFGINIKKYKPDNQPWLLNVGGKGGKKFRGIREGGVAENAAWFVFMQGKDGSFEAYPIDEWYNFSPMLRYKSLSAEEAEKEFERRDKIMNYFQVMFDKKLKKDHGDQDDEEGGGKKKGRKKKDLVLSEMDDWVSDDDDDDRDDEDNDDDDLDKPNKKKKASGKKREQGGKKANKIDGDSDDSCLEESDDFDEGAEHDYISGDSSDSDHENDEVVRKDLAGVEEGEALKKLLESDESSEEEKKDEEDEEKEKKEEEVEGGEKKKKKKKKEKKQEKNDSSKSPDNSSDDDSKGKNEESSERKKTINELKRKAKENPYDIGVDAKKMKMDNGPSTLAPSGSDAGVTEDAIRRYLMRKPMTTTELLTKLKNKKTGLSSEQLVQSIAQILKRVNPVKQMIKGKMYLSIKN